MQLYLQGLRELTMVLMNRTIKNYDYYIEVKYG